MSDHTDPAFERRLRQALQPTDPPDGFAERVVAAVERTVSAAGAFSRTRPAGAAALSPWRRGRAWLPAAMTAAVAVLLAGGGALWHAHVRELRARQAHEQVRQALRISSEALNAALKVTADPSQRG